MADQFFTPAEIANRLIASFRSGNESCIADFAAGEGELLRAAQTRWPDSRILATDIDPTIVRRLRANEPSWNVGRCDFLKARSRKASQLLQGAVGRISLALLNPPFSCRGNQRYAAVLDGSEVLCSLAMAFLVNAVPYVCNTGRIGAILPASCICNEKDAAAWNVLKTRFSVRVVKSFGLRTFAGCAARTSIVVLNRSCKGTMPERSPRHNRGKTITVRIVRGAVPMHAAVNGMAGSEWPLVHTTDLLDSRVTTVKTYVRELHRYVVGPAVLLPRVGEPKREKCVLYLRNRRLVLSDCVFAVTCRARNDAEALHARLVNSWKIVSEAYAGTCARYMTINRLRDLLGEIGCRVTQIEATGFGIKDA
jgi:predicted RNA methylase